MVRMVSRTPIVTGRDGIRNRARVGPCIWALLLLTVLAAAGCKGAPNDSTPPGVRIGDPSTGATLSGTVPVQGAAWVTNGSRLLTLVEVQIDSGGWKTASGTTIWSFRLDTVPLEDGWHTLRARSFDGVEYSEPEGFEFESRNADSSGDSAAVVICLVVVVVLTVAVGVGLFYYISIRAFPSARAQAGGIPPPVRGYPPQRWYTDQAGRTSRYADTESLLPLPRPPAAGVLYPGPALPRIPSPGGGQGAAGTDQEAPDEGGAMPPLAVVEYEDEGAASGMTEGLEIEETQSPDAAMGGAMTPEVIEAGVELPPETVEVVDMEAGASPELRSVELLPPEEPSGPAPTLTGGDRHARVMRALIALPRGLPLPLLGITTNELADLILRAPRKIAPGGSPLVQLKGRWYRADEDNLKEFMVEYKP